MDKSTDEFLDTLLVELYRELNPDLLFYPVKADEIEVLSEAKAALQQRFLEERLDERESMVFISGDGEETHIPFVQYRYKKDGLLLSWEDRTAELQRTSPNKPI